MDVTFTVPDPEEGEEWTDAQALGLTVVGTMNRIEKERDDARRIAVRLEGELALATQALRQAVAGWPTSTWAQDSLSLDHVRETLAELTDPGE